MQNPEVSLQKRLQESELEVKSLKDENTVLAQKLKQAKSERDQAKVSSAELQNEVIGLQNQI